MNSTDDLVREEASPAVAGETEEAAADGDPVARTVIPYTARDELIASASAGAAVGATAPFVAGSVASSLGIAIGAVATVPIVGILGIAGALLGAQLARRAAEKARSASQAEPELPLPRP